MQLKFASILSLLFASSYASFVVPADQEDGIYDVSFDDSGEAIFKKVGDLDLTKRQAKPKLEIADSAKFTKLKTRDFPSYDLGCTGHDIVPHEDYGNAQLCLGAWLDQGNKVQRGTYRYCKSDRVILALCNYADWQGGSSGELDTFNGDMDRICGFWRSGWIHIHDWNKTYWRDIVEQPICTNL